MTTLEPYQPQVSTLLEGKESVAQGLGAERFIYLIICISILFLLTSLIMTVVMVLHRKVQNERNRNDFAIRDRFQDFLSSFLLLPVDEAFIGIQQNQQLVHGLDPNDINCKKRRMILAEEMYKLQKDLSGQQKIQLTNYFLGLGLQNDICQLLASRDWTTQIKGLQMVGGFGLVLFVEQVEQLIYSDNMDLSLEAIVAIMRLEDSLEVLNKVKRKLTDWEMHKIYSASINNRKLVKELREMSSKSDSNLQPILSFLPNSKSEQFVLG